MTPSWGGWRPPWGASLFAEFWQFLGPAAVTAALMSPVHCLFGLHIVRRGVIFIDLAVAQMAGLGMAFAVRAGHEPGSSPVYWVSLGFALVGALLISLSRFKLNKVPHEAMIGIFFVVSSAVSVLILQSTPHGAEELQRLLTGGDILLVSKDINDPYHEAKHIAGTYGALIAVLAMLWRQITAISLKEPHAPRGGKAVFFDFLFYSLLAFVVASSVQVVGVPVVFTWLVMPGVAAFLWVSRMGPAILFSIPIAVFASFAGMWASYRLEWPTGPAIVTVFGALVAASYLLRLLVPLRSRAPQELETATEPA